MTVPVLGLVECIAIGCSWLKSVYALHVLLMPLHASHNRGLLVGLRIRLTRVAAGDVILTLRAVEVTRHPRYDLWTHTTLIDADGGMIYSTRKRSRALQLCTCRCSVLRPHSRVI